MFGTILTTVVTLMHLYVFWRADSLELRKRYVPRKVLMGTAMGLWTLFFLGRVYGHHGTGMLARTLELLGMNWMATLFLLMVCLLLADLGTGFGLLMRTAVPHVRTTAFAAGLLLALIAHIQGLRPPVVRDYVIELADLPPALDGTVLVGVSDLHVGEMLSVQWLSARVDQVLAEKPDIIVLLGDLFEGHGEPDEGLLPVMQRLSAPLGVWAVRGNHGSHGRRERATAVLDQAGIRMLRTEWAQPAEGLILAGVDDLTSSRRQPGEGEANLARTFADRPQGATVFLSHTPWMMEKAAAQGAGLMLSGHTHGGQVWPFGYLVMLRYPLLAGRYEVDGMPIIVCRGTGSWGTRMRLWHPGEILKITLRCRE